MNQFRLWSSLRRSLCSRVSDHDFWSPAVGSAMSDCGHVGIVRIGRINGQFVVNPTTNEMTRSDLDLVYVCTNLKTLIIDGYAREISESELEVALRIAHSEAVKLMDPHRLLGSKAGKLNRGPSSRITNYIYEKVKHLTELSYDKVFSDQTCYKENWKKAARDVDEGLNKKINKQGMQSLLDGVRREVVSRMILLKGIRVDGRQPDEIRSIYCDTGIDPGCGSSLVYCGETRVICRQLGGVYDSPLNRLSFRYTFPPYAINEVGEQAGLASEVSVGYAELAEKCLVALLPPKEEFPHSCIYAEVMGFDGSTAMTSVSAASLSLMNAGVQMKEHVAGVSMGLVSNTDPYGEITDYEILTDINGLEDQIGGVDVKIAGTRNGVTAIQFHAKREGLPLDIICESLEPARKGRCQIINHMDLALTQDITNSPGILYNSAAMYLSSPKTLRYKFVNGFKGPGIKLFKWSRWELPRGDGFIMDTDGSQKNGNNTTGGIIRDNEGNFFRAFSRFCGEGRSVAEAELDALLEGLKQCERIGIDELEVEVDDESLVSMILDNEKPPKEHLRERVLDCKNLIRLNGWSIRHISRYRNAAAHYLTQLAHITKSSADFTLVEELGEEFSDILLYDKLGFFYPHIPKISQADQRRMSGQQ